MIRIIKLCGLVLFLGNCLPDIRRKQISLLFTGLMAGLGAVLNLLDGNLAEIPVSLIPGVLFILLSAASRGGIGAGDGIVLLAAGFFRTGEELFAVILAAVFLSGIYAAVLFMRRRRGEERFAFVPFLFLADLLVCLAGGI